MQSTEFSNTSQIAGFFTGGALAIRGGYKAARNGAISCAILLAVIEGVGIGFQKMFAGATKLEVSRHIAVCMFGGADFLTFSRPRNRPPRARRCSFKHHSVTVLRHSTLLRAYNTARTCISVCIHDGQHIGGGVPCNIESVGYASPRAKWKPSSAETSAKIISILKPGAVHAFKSRIVLY